MHSSREDSHVQSLVMDLLLLDMDLRFQRHSIADVERWGGGAKGNVTSDPVDVALISSRSFS
jgi:hypothetical protein